MGHIALISPVIFVRLTETKEKSRARRRYQNCCSRLQRKKSVVEERRNAPSTSVSEAPIKFDGAWATGSIGRQAISESVRAISSVAIPWLSKWLDSRGSTATHGYRSAVITTPYRASYRGCSQLVSPVHHHLASRVSGQAGHRHCTSNGM